MQMMMMMMTTMCTWLIGLILCTPKAGKAGHETCYGGGGGGDGGGDGGGGGGGIAAKSVKISTDQFFDTKS